VLSSSSRSPRGIAEEANDVQRGATNEQERTDDLPPVIWVTPEEGRRIFDEAVQAELGISGEEFIRR
jgi:hypothetical protein